MPMMLTRPRASLVVFTLFGLLAAGCPGPVDMPDGNSDGASDVIGDALPDALPDVAGDRADVVPDAGTDGAIDTGADATDDADATDASSDAADDTATDSAGDAGTTLEGDTCQTAVDTAPGHYAQQSTAGFTGNYGPGDHCAGTSGRDRVYSVRVPASARLTAAVTGGFADNFDPSVSLVLGPAANCDASPRVCLAGDDRGTASSTDSAQYFNASSAEQQVFVVVDNYSPADVGGVFDLDIAVQVILGGDTCVSATPITPGTLTGQTTVGYLNDFSGGTRCGPASGLDRMYAIDVPAGQQLIATAAPTASGYNPSLSLIAAPATNCEATQPTCLNGSDSAAAGAPESVRYTNRTTGTQTVFIVVDSASAADPGGPFTLTTTVGAPVVVPGDTCATAQAITPGTLPNETTLGFEDDYVSGNFTCGQLAGPDRVYAINVPPGNRLAVSVMGTTAGSFPDVSLVHGPASNCTTTSLACIGSGNNPVSYLNAGSTDETVLIIVDAGFSGSGGGYSLTTSVVMPPPGDTCATAPVITAGTLPNETTVGSADDYSFGASNGCNFGSGGDRAYAVVVSAGQRLDATVTSTDTTGQYDPALNLIVGPASRCETVPATCNSTSDLHPALTPDHVRYDNRTTADQTVYLVVDTTNFSPLEGTYSLDVTVATPPPPPQGDLCQNADAIAAPGTLTAQSTVGLNNEYGVNTGCATTASPDRVYSMVVPAGQQLTVTTVSHTTNFFPTVSLVGAPASQCDAAPLACLPFDSRGPSLPAGSARYTNAGTTDQTVFAIVDDRLSGTTGGDFDLTTALATPPPLPPGETCGNAVAITASGTFMNESTVGYVDDYDGGFGCSGTRGLDRVYTVDVAPGQSLTASVVSADHRYDPSIGLILGPATNCTAMPMCISTDDAGTADTVNTVRYTNAGTTTQTVLILVDSYLSGDPGGPFVFTVTLM